MSAMVASKFIQAPHNVVRFTFSHYRLQSKYTTASSGSFVLTQDILCDLNAHLKEEGESEVTSSQLGLVIKSVYGDAVERKRHRRRSESGEVTRLYAYHGLTPVGDDTVEPPQKVRKSSDVRMVPQDPGSTSLQNKIKELEKELKLQADVKNKEIAELKSQLVAEAQGRTDIERKCVEEMPLQWQTVLQVLQQELDTLYQAGGPFMEGPSTTKLLQDFSVSLLHDQLVEHSPLLNSIVTSLNCPAPDSAQDHVIHRIQGISALSILARRRSTKMKGLQLLISLMLVARAVNKQVIASLNYLGICLSYTQTMEWVKRLVKEVASDVSLKEGQWMLVYDNVNFQKKFGMRDITDTQSLGTLPAEWLSK